MEFLKVKILASLTFLIYLGSPLEASPQLFLQYSSMNLIVAHSKSPTPFLTQEELACLEAECNEVPFVSGNLVALVKNLAISQAGFFIVNLALYHRELLEGKVSFSTLFVLSSFEIGKNLINYVVTENGASIASSLLKVTNLEHLVGNFNSLRTVIHLSIAMWTASRLNIFRRSIHLPVQDYYSDNAMDRISGSAEVLKNFINFIITENTFPPEWSKPPVVN